MDYIVENLTYQDLSSHAQLINQKFVNLLGIISKKSIDRKHTNYHHLDNLDTFTCFFRCYREHFLQTSM